MPSLFVSLFDYNIYDTPGYIDLLYDIAGKLAGELYSDQLIILTSVEYVYTGFGTDAQTPIQSMTVDEAKSYIAQGEFGETNMLPKIEAAIAYLEKVPSGSVLITSLSKVNDAINGKTGTIITAS